MTEPSMKRGRGEAKMSLGEHLIELRKRLLISAVAIVIAFVAGWFLRNWVWATMRQPVLEIAEQQGRKASINYTDITSAFDLQVQIALFIAIILASPVWLLQLWAFFAPALTRREKLNAIGFLGSAIPLFGLGMYVGWMIFPNIVRLLASFAPSEDDAIFTARWYVDFVVKFLLAVGVGFVMPVLLVLLNFIGVLTAKSILKSWRVAILAITLFAAFTTPAADLISMFLVAAPMVVLYFIAALIAVLHDRRLEKKRKAELAEYGIADSSVDLDADSKEHS